MILVFLVVLVLVAPQGPLLLDFRAPLGLLELLALWGLLVCLPCFEEKMCPNINREALPVDQRFQSQSSCMYFVCISYHICSIRP